jgi:hypothetical protein
LFGVCEFLSCTRLGCLGCFGKGLGEMEMEIWFSTVGRVLGIWVVALKITKVWPHFAKYPRDIVSLPTYLCFGYICTFIEIWALLACWNTSWAGAVYSESRANNRTLSISPQQEGALDQELVELVR